MNHYLCHKFNYNCFYCHFSDEVFFYFKPFTKVSKSTIHTKGVSLKFLGVVKGNVTHGRRKGTSTGSTEQGTEKQQVEGAAFVTEGKGGDKHGDSKENACRVHDVAASSNLGKEGVGDTKSTSRQSGYTGKEKEDRLVLLLS